MQTANNFLIKNNANHAVVSPYALSVSPKNRTVFEKSVASKTALIIPINSAFVNFSGNPLQWVTFSKSDSNGK
jgi:hypothetical protein